MRSTNRQAWKPTIHSPYSLIKSLCYAAILSSTIAVGTAHSAADSTPPEVSTASGSGNSRPTPKPTFVTVATFNIKWYGLGGSPNNTTADETRDPHLKSFITKELAGADAVVFEEIVDVARLQSAVLPDRFKCQTYENNQPKHQHVVICWDKKYQFVKSPGESSYSWDDVAVGRHRPAVVGVLKTASGKQLLQIVGVHLKAMPGFSNVRKQQADLIASHLRNQEPRLPTLITGDFNTFDQDPELIQTAFDAIEDNYAEINNPAAFTFNNGDMASKFDRFWVSGAVEPASVPTVWRACNSETPDGDRRAASPYADLTYYNTHISDHCPVWVKVQVP